MQNNNIVSFPLSFAKENEVVYIVELKGGWHFKEKCINQGIIPGQKIKVLNITGKGPCIIIVNNARIMIGNQMLNKIIVRAD